VQTSPASRKTRGDRRRRTGRVLLENTVRGARVTIELMVFLPILPPIASRFGAPGIQHLVFGKPPSGRGRPLPPGALRGRSARRRDGATAQKAPWRDAWQPTLFCASAAATAVEPAFKPQYSEFGEFGAIRRVFLATGALNSSGLSSNSLCKGTRNYYSFQQAHSGFCSGFSSVPPRDSVLLLTLDEVPGRHTDQ